MIMLVIENLIASGFTAQVFIRLIVQLSTEISSLLVFLPSRKHVACAISGGVDSAVTAYMLLKEGYRVTGIFMKNWDTQNESLDSSTNTCSLSKDKEDAQYVCDKLKIPFVYVDFSKHYWNRVFSEFLNEYDNGLTPNPDILCNKYIKFPMLHEYCKTNLDSVDYLATGHYAQVKFDGQKYRLFKSQDKFKDQTFFLCQLDQNLLKHTLFPLGRFEKPHVRKIASEIGLERVSNKKGSVGICFIGKRKFSDFIDEYLPRKYGEIIDIETDRIIGAHRGIHHFTIGQRLNCVIQNGQKPYYVAKKDVDKRLVYAAGGTNHAALFCDEFYISKPHWISDNYEDACKGELILDSNIIFKFQQKHYETPIEYMKKLTNDNGEIKYVVKAKYAFRGLAPGQYAVFYSKEECIGSAKILSTPRSLYDLKYQGPILNTDKLLVKKYV